MAVCAMLRLATLAGSVALASSPVASGARIPHVIPADARHLRALRSLWDSAPADRRAAGLEFQVAPPPGVHGQPVAVQLSPTPEKIETAPCAAGLRAGNWVGSRVPVQSHPHWLHASQLPINYDARQAYPA